MLTERTERDLEHTEVPSPTDSRDDRLTASTVSCRDLAALARGTFQGEDAMEDKRLAANPSGLCMCGCGRKTKIVTKSDRRHGHIMGQPFRFTHGHSRPAEKLCRKEKKKKGLDKADIVR
jgi:hypothetical protein